MFIMLVVVIVDDIGVDGIVDTFSSGDMTPEDEEEMWLL